MGGLDPVSEDVERIFQELCLCPEGLAAGAMPMRSVAWKALQARLEGAVVEVKAATLASRNKNKFMVPDEIQENWRVWQLNVVTR